MAERPAMHKVAAHQPGELQRTGSGGLCRLGETEQQQGDQSSGDLDAHGVLGAAEEVSDPRGLLDPAKEQLDGPASLVEIGDLLRRRRETLPDSRGPSPAMTVGTSRSLCRLVLCLSACVECALQDPGRRHPVHCFRALPPAEIGFADQEAVDRGG